MPTEMPTFLNHLLHGLTHSGAETRPNHDDPELRTRTYERSPRQMFAIAIEAVDRLHRWKTVERLPDVGVIRCEARAPLSPFIDDVTITIGSGDSSGSTVDVASKARLGKGDLGVNRQHVLAYIASLDKGVLNTTYAERGGTFERPKKG